MSTNALMYSLLILWAFIWVGSVIVAYYVGHDQGRLDERRRLRERRSVTFERRW